MRELVPLSALVERVTEKNVGLIDRVFTVSAEHGLVDQETFFNKRVASKNLAGYTIVRPGDFVYNKSYSSAAPLGMTTRNHHDEAGVVSPLYIVFRVASECVLERYLELAVLSNEFASSLRGFLKEGGRAHGAINVSLADYFSAVVPVLPIAEQRRIVDLINAVDDGVAGATEALHQLERTLGALRDEIPSLAVGFETVTLGAIADVVGGITKDKNKQLDHFVEVPYLRVANVQRAHLDLSEMVTIRASAEKVSQLRLVPGDVLFNEGGDRDKLGRGWVWEGQIENCIHQNHVFRARLTSPGFDPYFVAMCANNSAARNWFETMGSQTTNLASINLTSLKAFPVPTLPPDVQRQVVETYLAVAEARDRSAVELNAMQSVRSALLAELLSGEHEIPESYDALLEGVS